jgi:hypothetical protein
MSSETRAAGEPLTGSKATTILAISPLGKVQKPRQRRKARVPITYIITTNPFLETMMFLNGKATGVAIRSETWRQAENQHRHMARQG